MSTHQPPDLAWRIVVQGYRLPGSVGTKFDSDWLKATLHMRAGQGVVKRSLKFLLLEELERLVSWLRSVRAGIPVRDLQLVEPELRFKYITRNRVPFVKLIYEKDERRRLTADTWAVPTELDALLGMLAAQLKHFPCRCAGHHDLTLPEQSERTTTSQSLFP